MNARSDGGGAVVLIVIFVLLLLLLIGGGGALFFVRTQQAARIAQAERLRAVEAQAQLQQSLHELESRDASRATASNAQAPVDDQAIVSAVEAVLRTQQQAWNNGDLDTFMDHYWKSDDLTFSSGGDTTRGWDATKTRYRERYTTREQMGRLTLSDFEITPLGDSAALVLGQWLVERDNEPLAGNFSLVMRKIDGRWVVIHDHTSRK